ncbi:MAG: hypothetical protein R2939_10470 [Kofleriaceae bacterium]
MATTGCGPATRACDAGDLADDAGPCTTACTVATCGDGLVWAGVEACDDGNTVDGDGCRGDCGKVEACGDGVLDLGEACDDGAIGWPNPADGCDACRVTTWQASVLVGEPPRGDEVRLQTPWGLTVDRDDNVYIANEGADVVLRRDATTGQVTVIAGTGVAGFSGDGGLATAAQLDRPFDVAVDGRGDVWITDSNNNRVRKVDRATGIITTVAGTGALGLGGDGGPATLAMLSRPLGLCVDRHGDVYVADNGNLRVRRISGADGTIATIAGADPSSPALQPAGDGGPALLARTWTEDLACGDDVLYLADPSHHRVRAVDLTTGLISTFAGFDNGTGDPGDGGPATAASLMLPRGVAIAPSGDVLITDSGRNTVRRVTFPAAGPPVIETVMGSALDEGFTPDGELALGARTDFPVGVAATAEGTILVVEGTNQRVRTIDGAGVLGTLVGANAVDARADNGEAMTTSFFPFAVLQRPDGTLAISGRTELVRAYDPSTGALHVVAGSGRAGAPVDGTPATELELTHAWGLAQSASGELYVADYITSIVFRVDATGVAHRVAGTGAFTSTGDGGPALAAGVVGPSALAFDAAGSLYVSEALGSNARIRRIDPAGVIHAVAGTATRGYSGDGGPATAAQLSRPVGLLTDAAGDLYVVDSGNHTVRRIAAATGIITTIAGTGVAGFGGDGGPATAAQLNAPSGAMLDGGGRLLIADTGNHRVRAIDPLTGVISTIAGTGAVVASGEGLDALAAGLPSPRTLTIAADGALLVGGSDRLRRIDPLTNLVTTLTGPLWPAGLGPLARSRLADPRAVEVTASGAWIAAGTAGVVERATEVRLDAVIGRFAQAVATADRARYRDAAFGDVGGIAVDEALGRVYLTETTQHRLHVVDLHGAPADPDAWTIAVLAGGAAGAVDGDLATARFRAPTGLFLDAAAQALYVVDTGNHTVRRIDLDAGEVTTIAGTRETYGYFGDGGAAEAALLDGPTAVTRCAASGDVFIADTGNHRVRRLAGDSGLITTVLGNGDASAAGQGAPAWTFPVDGPRGLACDPYGNLLVTSTTAVRLLPADLDHVVDGTGTAQTIFGAPGDTTYPASISRCLTGLATVADDAAWITDACVGTLIELWRQPAP